MVLGGAELRVHEQRRADALRHGLARDVGVVEGVGADAVRVIIARTCRACRSGGPSPSSSAVAFSCIARFRSAGTFESATGSSDHCDAIWLGHRSGRDDGGECARSERSHAPTRAAGAPTHD